MGRRTVYTQEIADELLARMREGETVLSISRDLGVSQGAIGHWQDDIPDFAEKYARARIMQGHAAADKAIERALQRSDNPQADRLEFDALRWHAGKLAPRHYGDKTIIGGDPDNPVAVAIRRIVVDK